MGKSLLFAIDDKSDEIIVSESLRGSNEIRLIERIKRYHAVLTLTHLANTPNIDVSIFKAMDKVCQNIYLKRRVDN